MDRAISHDPLVLLARRAAAAGAEVLARRDESKFNTNEKSAAGTGSPTSTAPRKKPSGRPS